MESILGTDSISLLQHQSTATNANGSPFKVLLWLLKGHRQTKILILTLDLLAAFISFVFAVKMATQVFLAGSDQNLFQFIFPLFIIFLLGSLGLLGAYQSMTERRPERELEIIFKGVSLTFLLIFMVNFIFLKGWFISRYILFLWWVTVIFLILLFRFSLRGVYNSLWNHGYLRERALLIGSGATLQRTLQNLAIQRHRRFEYVGIVTENGFLSQTLASINLPIIGNFSQIPEIIKSFRVTRTFLFLDAIPYQKQRRIMRACQMSQVGINLISDIYTATKGVTFDQYTGLLTIWSNGASHNGRWNQFVKRALDIAGSLVGTLIFFLIYPLIFILIKLDDHGPILYRRRILGKNGITVNALKFRTMCIDADKILDNNPELKATFQKNFKLKNDPRLTRVGRFLRKWSIDEIPQFLNVLKGQMSLVGPRMIVKEELKKYGPNQYKLLSVKPGMTGFWQTNGRQTTDYEERARMDMFYIDHWSIWMDIMMLFKTIWKVLKREGAM